MVLVDSSIWMEAARQHGRLDCKIGLESLIEQAEALICGPIRMEVLAGARPDERERMAAGLDLLPYRSFNETDWEFALDCAIRFTNHQHPAPFRAILIASLAIQWDCRIYTLDPVFEQMEPLIGVRVYHPGLGGKFQPETNARHRKAASRVIQEFAETRHHDEKTAIPAPKKAFTPNNSDIGLWD